MSKVIVTGCTGQVGSYFVDFLLKNTDMHVYGMARRSSNINTTNLSHEGALQNPRFRLVTGDLSDGHSINALVDTIRPTYFINLAAQSFVGTSWEIPEQTFDVGATAIIRILEAIRTYAPKCRFYNAGSSEEFGDVQYSPQNENHPLRARSPYGAAKIAARQIVKVFRESYNLFAIQGIAMNHESPRRGHEFITRKITSALARISANRMRGVEGVPLVLGNLAAKRDWSHAKDIVEGIWLMLNQTEPKEYLLSSNETHSVRQFLELAMLKVGFDFVDVNVVRAEPSTQTRIEYTFKSDNTPIVLSSSAFYRPAEVSLLWGDSTKAREELGWSPKISFDALIEEMVDADIALQDKLV
jgi:GDPmannose 4,6-dehydratase